jgi:hypothetical protein
VWIDTQSNITNIIYLRDYRIKLLETKAGFWSKLCGRWKII